MHIATFIPRGHTWSSRVDISHGLESSMCCSSSGAAGKWMDPISAQNSRITILNMVEKVHVCLVLFVFSVALSDDVKFKYKPATKPVRLFTDEELKRYDGTEVKVDFTRKYSEIQWKFRVCFITVVFPIVFPTSGFRGRSLFTWRWKELCLTSPKEKVNKITELITVTRSNLWIHSNSSVKWKWSSHSSVVGWLDLPANSRLFTVMKSAFIPACA